MMKSVLVAVVLFLGSFIRRAMAKAASFMTSLMTRLIPGRRSPKRNLDVKKKSQSTIVNWFSTSDLDRVEEDSAFLLDDSGLDIQPKPVIPRRRKRDSGYAGRFSSHEDFRHSWILEDKVCLDLEKGEVITYYSPELGETLVKASSVSSLLRCTSIQDKSLKVTRKRREQLAKRTRRQKYQSFKKAIFPDEGIETDEWTDDSFDEVLSPPKEKRVPHIVKPRMKTTDLPQRPHSVHGMIVRHNSVQEKSWEIRRRRKQIVQKKRRSAHLEGFQERRID